MYVKEGALSHDPGGFSSCQVQHPHPSYSWGSMGVSNTEEMECRVMCLLGKDGLSLFHPAPICDWLQGTGYWGGLGDVL